jgi:hypothetical protein
MDLWFFKYIVRCIVFFVEDLQPSMIAKEEILLRACSFIFNPYGLEGIDMDWEEF